MIRGRRRPRGMGGEEDSLGLRVTWKTDRLDVHPTPIARPNHRTTGSSAPSPSRPSHLPGDGGGLSIWEGPFLGFGRVGQEVPVEDVRRRRSRGGEDLPEKLRVGAQGQRPPVWFPRIRDTAGRGGSRDHDAVCPRSRPPCLGAEIASKTLSDHVRSIAQTYQACNAGNIRFTIRTADPAFLRSRDLPSRRHADDDAGAQRG